MCNFIIYVYYKECSHYKIVQSPSYHFKRDQKICKSQSSFLNQEHACVECVKAQFAREDAEAAARCTAHSEPAMPHQWVGSQTLLPENLPDRWRPSSEITVEDEYWMELAGGKKSVS